MACSNNRSSSVRAWLRLAGGAGAWVTLAGFDGDERDDGDADDGGDGDDDGDADDARAGGFRSRNGVLNPDGAFFAMPPA